MATKIVRDGIFGVTDMNINYGGPSDPVRIQMELVAAPGYNAHHLLGEDWSGMFPGPVIVKCPYCGQWAARRTACAHCGGTVD